jgi:outer membrane protein OmpA-like peptidoglycan-associated protein
LAGVTGLEAIVGGKMIVRPFIAASVSIVALASCATGGGGDPASVNPAACSVRDFNVYFDNGTTEISPAARESIGAVGDALQGCRINHVRIIGSAGAVGGAAASDERSEQRALVLADYLSQRFGWPRSPMELLATGERGAVTDEGLDVPMRRRARITVDAVAP